LGGIRRGELQQLPELENRDLNPAIAKVQQLFWGFAPPCLIGTAVKLGLFAQLKTHVSPQELAGQLGLSLRGVQRLLNALHALGILERREEFCLAPEYRVLFDPDSLLYLGDFFVHAMALQENWSNLPEVVRRGGPLPREKDPKFFATLAKGLFAINWFLALELAERLSPAEGRVLDVAGGSGVWSAALLQKNPSLRGTVMDLPPVIEHATVPILKKIGLANRYSLLPGDLFETPWPTNHSMVLLAHIFHSFGQEQITATLQKARESLAPDGRLVIVDFFTDHTHLFPYLFSLNMLIATPEGNVYSEEEYRRWLRACGFEPHTTIRLSSPWPSGALVATPKSK
jgi:SAM-dependent methyltransferase